MNSPVLIFLAALEDQGLTHTSTTVSDTDETVFVFQRNGLYADVGPSKRHGSVLVGMTNWVDIDTTMEVDTRLPKHTRAAAVHVATFLNNII